MKKKTKVKVVDKTWMSVKELSIYLGISKETVYRMLTAGYVPCHRIGKLHRFEKSEIDKWVKSGGAE